jgi:hypothetical protein
MTKQWGVAVGGVLAAATMIGVTACSGSSPGGTTATPTAAVSPQGSTLAQAVERYQGTVQELQTDGCPAECGPKLSEVYNAAQLLRKTMNESGAAPGTFSEPYLLIDQIQAGFITGSQLGEKEKRPLVLSPAYKLDDWLDMNPIR